MMLSLQSCLSFLRQRDSHVGTITAMRFASATKYFVEDVLTAMFNCVVTLG